MNKRTICILVIIVAITIVNGFVQGIKNTRNYFSDPYVTSEIDKILSEVEK